MNPLHAAAPYPPSPVRAATIAAIAGSIVDSSTIDFTYDPTIPSITAAVKTNSLTAGYLNATTNNILFGRVTAGSGAGEEITCTAAGRDLLDDISASAQRTTLGLGTIATQNANAVAITGGTINGVVIGGSTPAAGTFTNLQSTSLTSGRVTYAGASGLLQDNANLTFNGTMLTLGTTASSATVLTANGVIFAGRNDTSSEGGQVSLARASDGAAAWAIDSFGSTSTPTLRFVDVTAGSERARFTSGGTFTSLVGGIDITCRTGDAVGLDIRNRAADDVGAIRFTNAALSAVQGHIVSAVTGGMSFRTGTNVSPLLNLFHSSSTIGNITIAGSSTGNPATIGSRGETNTGLVVNSNGSGAITFGTQAGASPALQILDTGATNTRYVTLSGSNGGNPQIGVSAGSLNLVPNVDITGTLTVGGAAVYPSGIMLDFAGSGTVPAGWLLCDGSAISRTTYAALFAAIGTTWGIGDGSTTFNLPDTRRRTAVGSGGSGTGTLGNAVGNTGGSETHTLTSAEIPAHTHPITDPGHTHTKTDGGHTHANTATTTARLDGPLVDKAAGFSGLPGVQLASTSAGTVTMSNASAVTGITINSGSTGIAATDNNAGGGGSHNNLQPSYVVQKIIEI